MMANISLSWISLFHSTSDRDFDKKATGCHLPLFAYSWERTALVAKSELSASMRKGLELSGEVRIGAEVTRLFRVSKADCSSSDQSHLTSFLVRLKRGLHDVRSLG